MPAYRQSLDSSTGEFGEFGGGVSSASSKLDDYDDNRTGQIEGLRPDWKGDDYDALRGDSDELSRHCAATRLKMSGASMALKSGGAAMQGTVKAMEATDRAAQNIGYQVLPAPQAVIGPRQMQQIASAGVAAPAVQAAYQAGAIAFTIALRTLNTMVTVQDNITGTGLQQLTNSMRPLTAKSSLPVPSVSPLRATTESLDNAGRLRDELLREHAEFMKKTKKQRGPVLGAVMDKKTGEVFFGDNPGAADYFDPKHGNPVHPLLAEQIGDAKRRGVDYDPGMNRGAVGNHAEVYALNQALLAAERRGERPSLGDYMVDNLRTDSKNPGSFIRCCSNCVQVLNGVEGSGRGW
ncbi:YwqJ-related putative deaminase [Glycomyces sp. NRRL B-16210]|uniref:YwqJ-related putative deaminase n=1 Tax=Glycomyces sp. NRRL B-16210 TaxID=1463821 RepID=UPI0004C169EF|nr:YwqJ-related putative deaminase [Glycomyces sp. NRRL B-16210]